MNENVASQYGTGLSRPSIEQALVDAGKDLEHVTRADLWMLEDFHTMGRIATSQLADLVEITPESHVLDAGSGIGGTARFVADRCGCHVTAVDLTEEYCETARWLNRLVGLEDAISVHRGDVTDLPFRDKSFHVVFSQHVQMNIVDKPLMYDEARRVLRDGGRLALWDIAVGASNEVDFPLPWADEPVLSHLVRPDELRTIIEHARFEIEHWEDLTEPAAQIMQMVLAQPPDPLGLHAFVPHFAQKSKNLTSALSDGRLRAIQGVVRAM